MLEGIDVGAPQLRFVLNADGGKLADSFVPRTTKIITPGCLDSPYILEVASHEHLEPQVLMGKLPHLVGGSWQVSAHPQQPCKNIAISPWKADECEDFARRLEGEDDIWREIHPERKPYLEKDDQGLLVIRKRSGIIYCRGDAIRETFRQIHSGDYDYDRDGTPICLIAPLVGKIKILNPTTLREITESIESQFSAVQLVVATCNNVSLSDPIIKVNFSGPQTDMDEFIPLSDSWPSILTPSSMSDGDEEDDEDDEDEDDILDLTASFDNASLMDEGATCDITPAATANPGQNFVIKANFVRGGGTFILNDTFLVAPSSIFRLYTMSEKSQNQVATCLNQGQLPKLIHQNWQVYAPTEGVPNYHIFAIQKRIELIKIILSDETFLSDIDKTSAGILDRDSDAILWVKVSDSLSLKLNAHDAKVFLTQYLLQQSQPGGAEEQSRPMMLFLPKFNLCYPLSFTTLKTVYEITAKLFPGGNLICSKHQKSSFLTFGAVMTHDSQLEDLYSLIEKKMRTEAYHATAIRGSRTDIIYSLFQQDRGAIGNQLPIGPVAKPQANYDFEYVVFEMIRRVQSGSAIFSDDTKSVIHIHGRDYAIAEMLKCIEWSALHTKSSPDDYLRFLDKSLYKPRTYKNEPVRSLTDLTDDPQFEVLNFAEVAAINLYTHDFCSYDPPLHAILNQWLREGFDNEYTQTKPESEIAQALVHLFFLASGLNKLPNAKYPAIYRAEDHTLESRRRAAGCMISFKERGFFSASASFDAIPSVVRYANTVLTLRHHTAKYIGPLSKFPDESEALSIPSRCCYYPQIVDGSRRYFVGRQIRSLDYRYVAARHKQGRGYVKTDCIEPFLDKIDQLYKGITADQRQSYAHAITGGIIVTLQEMLTMDKGEAELISLYIQNLKKYQGFISTFNDISAELSPLAIAICTLLDEQLNKEPLIANYRVTQLIAKIKADDTLIGFSKHFYKLFRSSREAGKHKFMVPNDGTGFLSQYEIHKTRCHVERAMLGHQNAAQSIPVKWVRDIMQRLAPTRTNHSRNRRGHVARPIPLP